MEYEPEAQKHDLRRRSLIDLDEFWRVFDTRHPNSGPWTLKQRRNRQHHVPDLGLTISIYLSEDDGKVGVFFGEDRRHGVSDPGQVLAPFLEQLQEKLAEQPWQPAKSWAVSSIWNVDITNEMNWPAMCDWLVKEAERFEDAARAVLRRTGG